MKKIKGILLFGILTLLGISSSFSDNYNVNQSYIHLRGTSPSDIQIGSSFRNGNPNRYYSYARGLNGSNYISQYDNCPVYESGGGLNMVYYSGGGFDINYYCGGNGTTGKLYTVPPFSASFVGTEVVGQMFINYYDLHDIYPLVFDYSYNYFTFSNDYQLTYNGVSYYNIDSTGQFGYCFYGYSDSMSCVYRLSSTDFEFHYFQNQFGEITEEKGYILTPLYGTNKTFVFSYDSQNRLIYNIFSGVSDYISDFENFDLIDKGYIDTQSLNFLYRSLIGTHHYGSYARLSMSNSGLVLSSNYFFFPSYISTSVRDMALFSSSPITLQSDSSVPNILGGNGGNGNQSTGSIAINTGFLNLCLNNLEFGELNSYLCNKLLNGNNLVLIPGQTGYYLSYGYDENGNLRFWITYQEDLEEQMSGYIRKQDENGNWYTYLPEESNAGVDSSNGLKDYFNNWFEHGVFFSCPFHYTDSYYREFKLFGVSHFVPKLGQSFLYPIYCMGAGFREGKNIEFFSGVSLGLESQLLSSPDYNYLYRLFDLILSVLIMFFIIKIYHLLN